MKLSKNCKCGVYYFAPPKPISEHIFIYVHVHANKKSHSNTCMSPDRWGKDSTSWLWHSGSAAFGEPSDPLPDNARVPKYINLLDVSSWSAVFVMFYVLGEWSYTINSVEVKKNWWGVLGNVVGLYFAFQNMRMGSSVFSAVSFQYLESYVAFNESTLH